MERVLIGLFLRLLATRARVVLLGLLALAMVLLALPARTADDPVGTAWSLFSLYALGGLVPLSSLVFGSSALGDLVDDATLVHLWLRPVSRTRVLASAWVATLILVIPVAVMMPAAALAVARRPVDTIITASLAGLLGTLAYSAVFVALGLRVRRALAWGLAYILIWEGAIAGAGAGLARLAIRTSTRSIAYRAFEGESIRYPLATTTAVAALAAATLGALALGVRWLRKANVT